MRRTAAPTRRTANGSTALAVLAVVAVLTATLVSGALSAHAQSVGSAPGGVTELHVAPWGNDRWPGSRALPFATPAGAQRAVREHTAGMTGDIVVNLHSGTYRMTRPLTLSGPAGDSGQHGHRVIFQPYRFGAPGQARVSLSGGTPIHHWRPAAGGLWRADVGDLDTRQLYVSGRRAPRAALGHGLPGRVRRTATGFVTDSAEPQRWQRPGDIEFAHTFGDAFSAGRCGVAGIGGTAHRSVITMDQPCFRRANQTYRNNVEGATGLRPPTDVENSPSFLTHPGRWYLDRSRPGHHVLSYRPRAGQLGPPTDAVAATASALVRGVGTAAHPLHDVTLRGLTFAHATWLGPNRAAGFPQIIGNAYAVGDDPQVEESRSIPGAVQLEHAHDIAIEDSHFTHLGGQAILATDSSFAITVRGNLVEDVSGGALQVDDAGRAHAARRSATVENNRVRHIGVEYPGSWGIALNRPYHAVIAHNQLEHLPYSGIVVLNSEGDNRTTGDNRVLANRVVDTNNVLIDGGPIYLNGPQGPSFGGGALVAGNEVRDSTNPLSLKFYYPPYALYTDDGADHATVRDNVLLGNQAGFGGVAPRRVRLTGNFADTLLPIWIGTHRQVVAAHNTALPTGDPAAACRKLPACQRIRDDAGLQPAYRQRLAGR